MGSCNSVTARSLLLVSQLLQHQQGSRLHPGQSVLGLTVLTPLTAWYVVLQLVKFASGMLQTTLLILHANAGAFRHNVMQTAVAEVRPAGEQHISKHVSNAHTDGQ